MWIVNIVATIIFGLLGIYGGMCAISRWVRGYTGFFVFRPDGATIYLGISLFSFAIFLITNSPAGSWSPLIFLALMPFAFLGYVLWFVAGILEMGYQWMAPSALSVPPSFDLADGLMVRGAYAEAEQAYRTELSKDTLNIEALFRLCRALEAQERFKESSEELSTAYKIYMDLRDAPHFPKPIRQEYILRVTFALGDILANKLNKTQEACQLYERTLEILYGYRDADPLRERLKALERASRMPA